MCSLRYACTMCVFHVWASSSPQATYVPNFVSVASLIAELACGESAYSISQSLTLSLSHSPSLFDVPATKAFASEIIKETSNVTSVTEVQRASAICLLVHGAPGECY